MNRFALAIPLFFSYQTEAQCPFPDSIGTTGNCPGAVLTAGTACQQMSKIVWYNNNAPVDSAVASNNPSILTVAGGNGLGSAAN
jgi:hypothetical protein